MGVLPQVEALQIVPRYIVEHVVQRKLLVQYLEKLQELILLSSNPKEGVARCGRASPRLWRPAPGRRASASCSAPGLRDCRRADS